MENHFQLEGILVLLYCLAGLPIVFLGFQLRGIRNLGPGSKLTNASKNNRGLEGRNEECLLERRFLSFQSPLAISPVPNQSIQGLLKLSFIRVGAAGPNPQGSNTETKGEVPSKPIIRLQQFCSFWLYFFHSIVPSF